MAYLLFTKNIDRKRWIFKCCLVSVAAPPILGEGRTAFPQARRRYSPSAHAGAGRSSPRCGALALGHLPELGLVVGGL